MRRVIAGLVTVSAVAAALVAMPRTADAWKPPTHLFGVDSALVDAQDGTITVTRADGTSPVDIPVNAMIVEALNEYPEAYYAGTVGPDAFPDTFFGQTSIHPDSRTANDTHPPVAGENSESHEWLGYLWEQAWNPATPEPQRLENIAFAL